MDIHNPIKELLYRAYWEGIWTGAQDPKYIYPRNLTEFQIRKRFETVYKRYKKHERDAGKMSPEYRQKEHTIIHNIEKEYIEKTYYKPKNKGYRVVIDGKEVLNINW